MHTCHLHHEYAVHAEVAQDAQAARSSMRAAIFGNDTFGGWYAVVHRLLAF